MRLRFANDALEQLYVAGAGKKHYPEEVVEAYVRRIRHIEAAEDERDLRSLKSLHYEQLKGSLEGKDSMRLNKGWRLILEIAQDSSGKIVVVHEINHHYKP